MLLSITIKVYPHKKLDIHVKNLSPIQFYMNSNVTRK